MFSRTGILVSCFFIATSGFNVRSSAKNTIQDAHEQLTKKIKCWEPIEENFAGNHFSGEHRLSERIYDLCSYMPDSKDSNKGYVNGVDTTGDDYTNVLNIFHTAGQGYAMLNVCLQEALQIGRSTQVAMRCMCKRDGCNLPKGLTTFLDYNKLPMPVTSF
ncbi:Protein CBG22681 [Caenorhabditis briggsae]|nr:Protein CBG22681 [Caenorhabditis briggsae]ULT84147.1 hypothetical protein L3Y34_013054 [Caenorhabditis briggsae]UMM43389.1 hypothetical protein L5515_018902 [Caenorhabditis briggsae]CAP39220.1 Protein CBG22681 [Caenorhabditis briggsae]